MEHTSDSIYTKIKEHIGHNIVCAYYGEYENVTVECLKCNEVIIDANKVE